MALKAILKSGKLSPRRGKGFNEGQLSSKGQSQDQNTGFRIEAWGPFNAQHDVASLTS